MLPAVVEAVTNYDGKAKQWADIRKVAVNIRVEITQALHVWQPWEKPPITMQ